MRGGRASRGLFVGRFQPFHNGHLFAVKWILEREEEVVVAIGSPQHSHTARNPFTLGERIEMVTAALRDEGLLDRVYIAAVPDTNGVHSLWVPLVEACTPRFERVYTNDKLTRLLFEERGYPVHPIPLHDRERLEGTRIRRLIAEAGDWRGLVPPAVARLIEELNGSARLSRIFEVERGGAGP